MPPFLHLTRVITIFSSMAILVLNAFFCHLVITIKMLKLLIALAPEALTTTKWPLPPQSPRGERLSGAHRKMYRSLLSQRSSHLPKVTFPGALTQENWLNASKNRSSAKAGRPENYHPWTWVDAPWITTSHPPRY